MTMNNTVPRILRLKEVQKTTGLSRSTIYDHMKAGNFPMRVQLGGHSVGWVESEVLDWIKHIIHARDEGTTPF